MRGNHLIREARRRAGLSQTELAERLGTTQSAIARLESGNGAPTLARLTEVARACGLDIEVRLVPADAADAEWAAVHHNAQLSPPKRIERALRALRLAEGLRRAGAAAQGSAS